MQAHIKSKLIQTLITMVLLVGVTTIPLSISLFHSHAASASSQASWSVVPSPNVATSEDYLGSVTSISASDIWAVGCFVNETACQTLIEHWDGASWSVVPSPNPGTGNTVLQGVVALSTNNVWAVGNYALSGYHPSQTLIEHWDGASWSVVPSPNAGTSEDYLNSVTAISASDIWTVGYSYDGTTYQTLIEHWDGTGWSIVPSPNHGVFNSLGGVEALSASNVWAVGRYSNSNSGGAGQTLIEHWDGASWSVVSSPNNGPYGNDLLSVSAISANDIWATGNYALNSTGPDRTLIEHWDGTSWSVVPSLDPGSYFDSLGEVVAISTSDVWTVGEESSTSAPEQMLIEHWNGTSWSVVPSPSPAESSFSSLSGVTAISSSDVWAVGTYASSNSNCFGDCQTLIEHYYAPGPTSQLITPSPDPNTNSTSSPVPNQQQLAAPALGHLGQAIAVASLH